MEKLAKTPLMGEATIGGSNALLGFCWDLSYQAGLFYLWPIPWSSPLLYGLEYSTKDSSAFVSHLFKLPPRLFSLKLFFCLSCCSLIPKGASISLAHRQELSGWWRPSQLKSWVCSKGAAMAFLSWVLKLVCFWHQTPVKYFTTESSRWWQSVFCAEDGLTIPADPLLEEREVLLCPTWGCCSWAWGQALLCDFSKVRELI